VVDLGQLVGEHGLDHDALDLLDPPDVALLGFVSRPLVLLWLTFRSPFPIAKFSSVRSVVSRGPRPRHDLQDLLRDLGWRARFICRVRSSISSPAFSDALRIAVIRAPCSEAVDSSSARKIEIST